MRFTLSIDASKAAHTHSVVSSARRYAVFTGGHLAYWENIGGDRSVAPTGPTCEIEDTFAIYTKTAPAAEATRKIPLKRTLGSRTVGTGQVIFVMYDLPLFISKNLDGTIPKLKAIGLLWPMMERV